MEYLNHRDNDQLTRSSQHQQRPLPCKPLGFSLDESENTQSSRETKTTLSMSEKTPCGADSHIFVQELQEIARMDGKDIALDSEECSLHENSSSSSSNERDQDHLIQYPTQANPHQHPTGLALVSFHDMPDQLETQSCQDYSELSGQDSHDSRTVTSELLHVDQGSFIKRAEFAALVDLLKRTKSDLVRAQSDLAHATDHISWMGEQEMNEHSSQNTDYQVIMVDESEARSLALSSVFNTSEESAKLNEQAAVENSAMRATGKGEYEAEEKKELEHQLEECQCHLEGKLTEMESLRNLEGENAKLSERVSELTKQLDQKDTMISDLTKQLDQKDTVISSLHHVESEKTALNGVVQDLIEQLQHMDEKNSVLTKKIKASDEIITSSDRGEKWLAIVEERDAEIKRLTKELEDRLDDSHLTVEAHDYELWLKDAKEDNENLKKILAETKAVSAKALESESGRTREAELRLEQGNATIESLRLQLQESTARDDMVTRLEEENSQLHDENNVLENMLMETKENMVSKEAKIDELETDLSNSITANAQLHEHIGVLERNVESLKKKDPLLGEQANAMTEEAVTLISDLAALEERLHEVELEKERLRNSCDELQTKLSTTEREKAALAEELMEVLNFDGDDSEDETDTISLKEADNSKDPTIGTEETSKMVEDLIGEKERENEELREDVIGLEEQLKNSRLAMAELESELSFCQAKLSDVCDELNDRSGNMEELVLEGKYDELEQIETRYNELANNVEAKQDELKMLEEGCECKAIQLREAQAKLDDLERNCEITSKIVGELGFSFDTHESMEENVKRLQANYHLVVWRATDMSIELADCHSKIDVLTERAKVAEQQLQSFKQSADKKRVKGATSPLPSNMKEDPEAGSGGVGGMLMNALSFSPRKKGGASSPPKKISKRTKRKSVGRSMSTSLDSIREADTTEESSIATCITSSSF